MEENKVSHLALASAYLRGYHAMYDSSKIFDDFLAWELLGREVCESFDRDWTPTIQHIEDFDPKFASSCPDKAAMMAWVMQHTPLSLTVSRSRYTEDALEQAISQGVRQYVILGAGMDTFAFRHSKMLERIQVFEVDHPATQAFKRSRLAEAGWNQPEQLHFIPMDFQHERLEVVLRRSSYDPNLPSFFSWLGVTYYLPSEVVFGILAAITNIASSGITIVFDYTHSDVFIPERTSQVTQTNLQWYRSIGDPWLTGFEPTSLAADLAALGFCINEDLNPRDIEERFFQGQTDRYHAFELMHFASVVLE